MEKDFLMGMAFGAGFVVYLVAGFIMIAAYCKKSTSSSVVAVIKILIWPFTLLIEAVD